MIDLWYMLPFHIAQEQKHPNQLFIGLTNLLFGWTIIGWLVTLLWVTTTRQPISTPLKHEVAYR